MCRQAELVELLGLVEMAGMSSRTQQPSKDDAPGTLLLKKMEKGLLNTSKGQASATKRKRAW